MKNHYLCIDFYFGNTMGQRIKKIKNVRIHREGTDTLLYGLVAFVTIALILWFNYDDVIGRSCD